MECGICFDTITPPDNGLLKCSDRLCTQLICFSCLGGYLNHTSSNSSLPNCIGKDCHGIYLYSDVLRIDNRLNESYLKSCHQALMQAGENLSTRERILDALRKEKQKYVRKEFPLAISIVADITCKVKLNKTKKTELKKSGRICMNLFCSGILDENLVCMKCDSKFCKECERLIETGHKCKEEDVESMKVTKNLPKCPSCGIHVDKNKACDHVMCGVCGTKFIYGTDQLGGGGGHTEMVNVANKISLTRDYKNKLDNEMIKYILLIEGKEIKNPSYAPVLNAVKNNDPVKIARSLENYHRLKYAWKLYMRYMNEIEKLLIKGSITLDLLIQIYNSL